MATRLCPAWKAACFLRVVCVPHFWCRFKLLFLPSDPLVFSGPYWLFRENRNHLTETASASCQRIFSPDFICTRCPCLLPVLWRRCSSCFQRPPCLLFPSSHPLLLSGDSVFRDSPISLLCLQLLFLSDWPSVLAELSSLVLTAPRVRTTPSIWPLATPLQSWRWRHQGPHLLHPVEAFCLDITWLPSSILLGWRLLATWHSLSLVLRDATLLVFLFTAQVTLSSWFSASPALNYTYLASLGFGSGLFSLSLCTLPLGDSLQAMILLSVSTAVTPSLLQFMSRLHVSVQLTIYSLKISEATPTQQGQCRRCHLKKKKKAQCESCKLSFIWGKIRTIARRQHFR